MNKLIKDFDKIISSPNGINKTRELILQLAVQGKLTEQWRKENPDVETASKLLKGLSKKNYKINSNIDKKEAIFVLPNSWEYCILETLGITQTGTTPPKKDPNNFGNYIPFIGPGDIKNGKINYQNNGLSQSGLKNGRLIKSKSVLMVCIGGSIGKAAINNIDVTCNQQINTFTPYFKEYYEYYYIVLQSTYFQELVLKKSSGSATPIINKQKWITIPIPVAPLEEQKQIVEKVNSMMSFLDDLEEKQNRLNDKKIKLNNSSLDKLIKSENTKEFKLNWNRITQNFETLYSVTENVDKLKQTILQLAIQGKLTEQWRKENPNVEPASELLKKIKAELGEQNSSTKFKSINSKIIFQSINLPTKWIVTKLFNLISLKSGKTIPKNFEKGNGKYMYLKVSDMNLSKNQFIVYTSTRYIDESIFEKDLISSNSIIFPKRGGAIATNKKRIVKTDIYCDSNVMSMKCPKHINIYYLYTWFLTIDLWELNSGTSVPQINNKDIFPLQFNLPPFEEQKQIVKTVNELMAICKKLEEKIKLKTEEQEKLVEAVVSTAIV